MKRRTDIDYLKIFADKLQSVPAWRELAEACRVIIGREVDDRRRKLERMADHVKNRKGDILLNLEYFPEVNKEARYVIDDAPIPIPVGTEEDGIEKTQDVIDDSIVPIPIGTIIREAEVVRVHHNIAYRNHPSTTDYVEVRFTHKNLEARWLVPSEAPQEREILIKNAFRTGFEFFSSRLTTEDLQRIYSNIEMYWDQAGADDVFMDFIGFVKNVNLKLVPLWSYDDNTNNFPILSEDHGRPAYQGGKWYQTSHVEIQYDMSQFTENYSPNLIDMEDLFYFFAPIILVLERITATLEWPLPVKTALVAQEQVLAFASHQNKFEVDLKIKVAMVGQKQVLGFSIFRFDDIDESESGEDEELLLNAIELSNISEMYEEAGTISILNSEPGHTYIFEVIGEVDG